MINFFRNLFRRSEDELTADTLTWVNHLRHEYCLGPRLADLPKGYRAGAADCPIAKALYVKSDNSIFRPIVYESFSFATPDGNLVDGETPPYVLAWIKKFDDGAYPHYVV